MYAITSNLEYSFGEIDGKELLINSKMTREEVQLLATILTAIGVAINIIMVWKNLDKKAALDQETVQHKLHFEKKFTELNRLKEIADLLLNAASNMKVNLEIQGYDIYEQGKLNEFVNQIFHHSNILNGGAKALTLLMSEKTLRHVNGFASRSAYLVEHARLKGEDKSLEKVWRDIEDEYKILTERFFHEITQNSFDEIKSKLSD